LCSGCRVTTPQPLGLHTRALHNEYTTAFTYLRTRR